MMTVVVQRENEDDKENVRSFNFKEIFFRLIEINKLNLTILPYHEETIRGIKK